MAKPLRPGSKRAIIAAAKAEPCHDCREQFPAYCMDFHHLHPIGKLFEVSRWKQHTLAELRTELSKCIVLCANCHRIRTAKGAEEVCFSDPRAKQIIAAAKTEPCHDCGKRYSHVMVFHHVHTGEKFFEIAQWQAHTDAEVIQELEKCIVICTNCHRIRHHHLGNLGIGADEYPSPKEMLERASPRENPAGPNSAKIRQLIDEHNRMCKNNCYHRHAKEESPVDVDWREERWRRLLARYTPVASPPRRRQSLSLRLGQRGRARL